MRRTGRNPVPRAARSEAAAGPDRAAAVALQAPTDVVHCVFRMREGNLHITDAPGEELSFERVADTAVQLERELAKSIVGQQRVVREILIAFLAGGHCLLRGVPGLAKTLLIKKLAEAVDLGFNRIQFTPDLMPSDILGAEMIEEDRATGKRMIRFIRGPIFANIILADEINRAPAKVQAALLEAM